MAELMERYPRIAINALRIVGRRLDELQHRFRELTTDRAEQRIAHALVRLARQAGRAVAGGVEIGFPLSRRDIAATTGSAHFTVSRILSDWEKRGLLGGGRRRIVVCDPAALEAIANRGSGPGD